MQSYRARSSLVWGWLCVALGAAIAIAAVVAQGWGDATVAGGLGLAFAALGVAVFLRPSIEVQDDYFEVRNIARHATVPFEALESIESRWTVEFVTKDGATLGSFAAPARSAREQRLPADQRSTAAAAGLVNDAWKRWRASGNGADAVAADAVAASSGGSAPQGVTWALDYVGIAWLGAVVAGLVLAFAS